MAFNSILVIGGGIAGVQASLDLADQGYKVYLVEKSPSIGGRMAQLDKTFPTNDCSMCMLAPKVVTCGRHPNIELLTYAEVKAVSGEAGAFTVKIEKKPRYVKEDKCTGCGLCIRVCPIRVPNEFDMGLVERKAVYVPFPQAVPNVVTIDKENCIDCRLCEKRCKAEVIDHDQKAEEIDVKVGSIIVATGYDVYEPYDSLADYGYGRYPNVLTALEFERLLNASGPTGGRILRPSDLKKVRRIAFVQCVGSRSPAQDRPYCSRFCCTHATKEAIIAREHEKGINDIHIFYNDMRTFGKGFEEYRQRASDEYGIDYIKGIPGEIQQTDEGDLIVRYEDQRDRKIKDMTVDLVVLSTAALPRKDSGELAEILGIKTDEYGFIQDQGSTMPVATSRQGIFACGASTAPRDIPDSVAQASGAAMEASMFAEPVKEKGKAAKEIDVAGKEPRIGVFVCHCGINIGGVVDVPGVSEYAGTLPNVVHAENNLYTCSADALKRIQEKIKKHDLNRVVVASCTPRTHEPLFRTTCGEAGLNKYLFEMANIRDQCSWVHMHEPEKATEKSKDLVRMAVVKAGLLDPLYEEEIEVTPSALVLGAGISGMTAALSIAKRGFKVYLTEKSDDIGGLLRGTSRVFPEDKEAGDLLAPLVREVKGNKNIELLTSTVLREVKGYVGNFEVALERAGNEKRMDVGTIVVATGAKPLSPEGMYGYGKYRNVVTQLELEELIAEDKVTTKSIVMIQCVGAREKENRKYCSRICCMVAIKNAVHLKERFPDVKISIVNRDIMAVGKSHEAYYRKARDLGVTFIKHDAERPPKVREEDRGLTVEVYNETLGREITLTSDMVVLSTPLVPSKDNKKLSQMLKVPLDQNGFFLEAHAKLRPVDFATDGIYLCGTAHSPKDIEDSVSQALGAASRATMPLSQGRIKTEATTSLVDPDKCIGCANCEYACPQGTIKVDISDGISRSNPALCKGCGSCAVECPAEAITMRNFTDDQIKAMIEAALATLPKDEPKIISFLCNWCAYAGADLAGVSRLQYPPNTRTIRMMCTGRIDPLFIYHAFLLGADGVLVGGCHIGDCHYVSGNQKAEKRMKRVKKQIAEVGLEPERLKVEWVSASEGQRFVEVVTKFTEELKGLDPSPLRKVM